VSRAIEALLAVNIMWSFAFTLLAYTPVLAGEPVLNDFGATTTDLNTLGSQIQGLLTEQTNIPVLDLGALLFYSGTILVDFLINFIYAVPSMLTAILHVFLLLFGVDAVIGFWIKLGVYIFAMIAYTLMLLNMVIGIRAGRGGII